MTGLSEFSTAAAAVVCRINDGSNARPPDVPSQERDERGAHEAALMFAAFKVGNDCCGQEEGDENTECEKVPRSCTNAERRVEDSNVLEIPKPVKAGVPAKAEGTDMLRM